MSAKGATALDERRALRRREFLSVGVGLLGDPEGAAVTVRAACRGARLTERYFYESFRDRDEFVREVYEDVGRRAHSALVGAVEASKDTPRARAEAAVKAFVELMADTPAMGRVLLMAPLRDPALSGRGAALMPMFVEVVQQQLSGVTDPTSRRLTAIGVVGALSNLFVAYLDGTAAVPRDRFIAHCVELLITAARVGG